MNLLLQIVKLPIELLFALVFTTLKGLAFFSPVLIALGIIAYVVMPFANPELAAQVLAALNGLVS